jgi:cell fate regulator YaaT (PSP1 superfamily)
MTEPAETAGPDEPQNGDQEPSPPQNDSPDAPDPQGQGKGKSDGEKSGKQTVVARYGAMRQIGEFRHSLKVQPTPGTKLVVRSERGVELAETLAPVDRGGQESAGPRAISIGRLDEYIHECGKDYPFGRNGRVLRLANSQDLIDYRHLESTAHEAGRFCRKRIAERKLPMRLVTVEHTLGGERIIFYFTAESRVDFRELVRDLASEFRTRIEMRQVGARDEARLVGDYERCGQHCCCRQFIKDLKPVSMRMAKQQKATLDPAKISGRCGRLMCCLRYEDKCYKDLRKNLPKRNTWVRTATYLGQVHATQTITQLVQLRLPDGTIQTVANEEITEHDVAPPDEQQRKQANANHAAARRKEAAIAVDATLANEETSNPSAESTSGGDGAGEASSGKRDGKKPSGDGKSSSRGRRRGGKGRGRNSSGGGKSSGGEGGGKSKNKRRRRRKKNRPSGGSNQSGQGGNSGGS